MSTATKDKEKKESLELTEVVPTPQGTPAGIIKKYVLLASGTSILPLPLFDLAAILGYQLAMVKELSNHYGIKFAEHKVKNIVGPLLSSIGITPMLTPVVASVMKIVPIVGTIAGTVALPTAAGATTYAVGRVFNTHFAAGGTFLDFDPNKTRAYFDQMYREGQKSTADRKEAIP
jgi:uncharacterized protein (DUF697 family)